MHVMPSAELSVDVLNVKWCAEMLVNICTYGCRSFSVSLFAQIRPSVVYLSRYV